MITQRKKYLIYMLFMALPLVMSGFSGLNLVTEVTIKKTGARLQKEYYRITNPKVCELNHHPIYTRFMGYDLFKRDIYFLTIIGVLTLTTILIPLIIIWKRPIQNLT